MRAGSDLRTLALAVSVALARGAHADSHTAADEKFERGRELMKQRKFEEACTAFEQSHRLDPQLGTLFNLADCEVQLGKLATAWNRYRELARADPNAERRAMSEKLAERLAARIPKLLVQIEPLPEGAAMSLDGRESTGLVGIETPVDLGSHEIVVTAPGYQTKHKTIAVDVEGHVYDATIKLKRASKEKSKAAEDERERADEVDVLPSRRLTYAKAAVIGGGVLLVGGLVAGGLTYSKWDEAQNCASCDRPATSRRAILYGNVSTALVIAGAIPVAIGVYLWKTSSSSATVSAQIDTGRAGFSLTTTF